jgi:tyrosine-protein phosphatase OCA1
MSEDTVLAAMDIILDPQSYPLYIMDHLGKHRTGLVVGCMRKLQRWHLSPIVDEYRRYARKVRLQNEQFIELFDTDLVRIPEQPPAWLL